MPHGRLTPLGKQLASVLANLRPASPCRTFKRPAHTQYTLSTDSSSWTRARSATIHARSRNHGQLRRQSAAVAQAQQETVDSTGDDGYRPFPLEKTSEDDYGVGRLAGIDSASMRALEEFSEADRINYLSELQQSDVPIRYISDKRPLLLRGKEYPMYYRRDGPTTAQLRLEEILYRFVERGIMDTNDVDAANSLELSKYEKDLLESRNYPISTIKYWAATVMKVSLHDIALHLERLQTREDTVAVPLYVLFHLLRKPYISARTLKVLLGISIRSVAWYDSVEGIQGIDKEDIFTLSTLLLRRVRDVWPDAMVSVVDMLLKYLPCTLPDADKDAAEEDPTVYQPITPSSEESDRRAEQLASLTFRLNNAMRLLAVPTSINPFQTIAIQEQCVIRILRFLAEHDPPLEINRDGFRAVVLIQLAQPKSADDRLWAELKALSWPPWKVDRTAMDADVTHREQGRSKAAETLERMREAGFAPYEWEQVAGIYTGWDIDGTPGTQTRVTFSSSKKRFESGAAAWCARILTTRSLQEAWACYLAYSDQCTEPDQDVCKSMFRKLYEEGVRTRNGRKYRYFRTTRAKKLIWPGDAREIEPPPPSVHEHTYTRTDPPDFNGFWRQLRRRGVVLEAHCLAYVVSKADSLAQGLRYLWGSQTIYPGIPGLLGDPSVHDTSDVPEVVLAAFMELLGRFSNFSLQKALPWEMKHLKPFNKPYRFDTLVLNANHALAHGAMLLKRRLPLYRPGWHSILRSLGHSSSLFMLNIGQDPILRPEPTATPAINVVVDESVQDYKVAFTAMQLAKQLLSDMRSINIEIDAVSFLALCNVSENWALSCWMEMRRQVRRTGNLDLELKWLSNTLTRHEYPRTLERYFMTLVGSKEPSQANVQGDHMLQLPRLLEVPGPAILHAYIRALGWMADYAGLLKLLRWMVKFQHELQERRDLERNGAYMMRRALTALRVFLERNWLAHEKPWLPPTDSDTKKLDAFADPEEEKTVVRLTYGMHGSYGRNEDAKTALKGRLHRLGSPASDEVLMEIKEHVESVEQWGGWPTEDEVQEYCKDRRFQQFLDT